MATPPVAAPKPEAWIKVPVFPLVTNIFLPTAPLPKTSQEVDFGIALAPCIRKGHEETVQPLLDELTSARRTALASLDPSRTICSAESVTVDTRKYLALLRGFRNKATEPPAATAAPADGLPPAYVDVAGVTPPADAPPPYEAPDKKEEVVKPKRNWFGQVVEEPPSIEGSDDTAPVAALPMGGGSALVDKPISTEVDVDDIAAEDKEDKSKTKKGKAKAVPMTPPVKDGTLRHMVAFTWRDLGDNEGQSFRVGDTMLEEASVLFALAQVLLQKAKAEPLNETSMLDVFKWLKQSSGVLSYAVEVVKLAKAPLDHTSDDLKNGLLTVLVDVSLAQAQHVTVRRAMATMQTNKSITHALIAKLCNDTAERYKAMEPAARGLCGESKREGVGAYVMAHLRYKQLYFMGMAYAMVGLDRITSAPENLGYGIRDIKTAKELWDKAEVAGKVFIEAARSIVFVDNLSILQQLNDCQASADDAITRAQKENDTVYFKTIPEKPDALPDRMSNLMADAFDEVTVSSCWTSNMYSAFDLTKTPKLYIGKVPETVDCCPQS